jgi:hypothetical protein
MLTGMKKETALPIRLDSDTKTTLNKIAEATGLTVSAIVRMLVKSFVDEYNSNSGNIMIPPQWKTEREQIQYKAERNNFSDIPKAG